MAAPAFLQQGIDMTCKGIRPDGNQCTCPDEYTRSGLCASCAAPETTALVPVGSTGLMADPAVDVLYAALQPHMREFIKAYMETLTMVEAAEVVGVSRQSHYYWAANTPGYRDVFEVAEDGHLRTMGGGGLSGERRLLGTQAAARTVPRTRAQNRRRAAGLGSRAVVRGGLPPTAHRERLSLFARL